MDYLTTAEAASLLGITARRVADLIYDTRLPAECVNGRWFIKPDDLQLEIVRHRPTGRPRGRKSSASPLPYQPVPKYLREYILWRDERVCQLCACTDASSYVTAHIIARGPARPANLFLSCRGCNVRQGQVTLLPNNFESITTAYPRWRSWVHFVASLPEERQQAVITLDLHDYSREILYN